MTPIVRPVGRWDGQPAGFNAPAAEAVYKAIMALPDDATAAIYGRIIVEGLVQHELVTKQAELTKAIDGMAAAAAERRRTELAHSAVIKARKGESAAGELAEMTALHKALSFTDDERREFARKRTRDLQSGRFVREHAKIGYDSTTKPLSQDHAGQFGIPKATHLKDKDLARYQQAYGQVHAMLAPFTGMAEHGLVHLHIHDSNGPKRTVEMAIPARGEAHKLREHLGGGEHLDSVSVSVVPPETAAGAAYDALAAAGAPAAGGVAYTSMTEGFGDTDRLHQFRTERETQAVQDEFVPSQRIFRNLASGSSLLRDSLGDAAPKKMKFALAVGEHVGRYGPEAQKVIGPTADRAAYRYRGTERPVGEKLQNRLAQLKNTEGIKDKRWYMLHGNAAVDGTAPESGWRPSGILEHFRAELPDANLSTLHLKSGAVPPSRGIVFDKTGKTSVEAVGYGDDHYLPFNLRGKSFRSLRGGEYIRTRTFGGPTTEDIYTGLMSGAKGLAVVSHNGVFTVDFADDLKGGKRFNDNAARMVGRYGHLLDAVRSEEVTTGGIPGSRMREIRAQAESLYPSERSPEKYQAEVARLKNREKDHPQLSQAARDKATTDFFATSVLAPGRGVGDARQAMVSAYIHDEAGSRWAKEQETVNRIKGSYPDADVTMRSLEYFQTEVRQELTGDNVADVGMKYAQILGMEGALNQHLKRATAEYGASLQPLRLNGEGYKKALDALQEEFPHYVANVQFHPWGSSRGPLDSGYVRPRHNRAAEALSGYFDTRVSRNGTGKVYADSTRWQNGRREVIQVKDKPVTAAAGGTGGGGTTARAGEDEGTTAALRARADRDLFNAIKTPTVFGPLAQSATTPAGTADGTAMRGYPIADALSNSQGRAAIEAAAPNLFKLYAMTPENFEAEYAERPDAMRATLASARAENQRLRWLDVPATVEGAFDRGGKAAPRKVLGKNPSMSLNTPDAEFDFDGPPAFDAAMRPSTAQVLAAYSQDSAIAPLIARGDLPATPADPTFKGKADALVAAIKTRRDRIVDRAQRDGIIPTDEEWASIDAPAEGVLRARQLARRHAGAAEAEIERVTPEPMGGGNVQNTVELHLPPKHPDQSDEDYQNQINEVMARYRASESARANRGVIDG